MKIAIITDHIPTRYAHSINTMKIAQGFFKMGYDVRVLAVRRYTEEKNRYKIKNIHNFYGINKKIKIKYFRDYSPYYFWENHILGSFFNIATKIIIKLFPKLKVFVDIENKKGIFCEKKISEYCQNEKIALAFCRRVYKIISYNVFNKIPTVLDLHGFEKHHIAKLLKMKINPYFKGILTINNTLKKKFIKLGFLEEKIIAMENCVDLTQYDRISNKKMSIRKHLNLPLDKKIILYTGKLSKDRGIETVLRSSLDFDRNKYSFYLIGGNNKSLKMWKKYIYKNKIESDINLLGFIEKIYIPFYLKAADILLATYSPSCPTLDIMSPVKIIEYMASKNPIIATKIGRNVDLWSNNELLFIKPDDPKDLTAKVKLLVTDDDLRSRLIKNAYSKARRYSIEKRCEKILELYG